MALGKYSRIRTIGLCHGVFMAQKDVAVITGILHNMLSMQANVQRLAVEAAVHVSKELALQALLIDPVVNSSTAALKILDELWEMNKPYIRKCV